jgi:uncharacterized protein
MRPRKTFNAFELARDGGSLEGTFDVADLERLADRVAEGSSQVSWRIAGTRDEAGRPALEIAIEGEVPVTCQRCLSDFAYPVDHRTLAVLARSESEADALDEASDHEVVVADRPLDPAQLVEDELLLTLPFAPMHEEACAP